MRQKRVLLRFVEAVDLIHEHSRSRAVLARSFRVRHDLLDFFDPRKHCAELDELRAGHVRDDLRQRGLTSSWRSPQDQGSDIVALNLRPQRLARRDQVLLPDEFIQRARTHPVRQRPRLVRFTRSARNRLKQAHKITTVIRQLCGTGGSTVLSKRDLDGSIGNSNHL